MYAVLNTLFCTLRYVTIFCFRFLYNFKVTKYKDVINSKTTDPNGIDCLIIEVSSCGNNWFDASPTNTFVRSFLNIIKDE